MNEKIEAEIAGFAHRLTCAVEIVTAEWTAPSVVHRPKIYLDGDQWCALLGSNIMEGVCGFGKSPADAARAFDLAWNKRVS